MSGNASRPTDYSNHPNNNQKTLGFNPGILVTVEEYVIGLRGHHIVFHLEGSGAVEVPGVISDDFRVTTSRKSLMFSSSASLPSSSNTPNISITSILPRRSPRLTPIALMMPYPHDTYTIKTTH